jgi:hypothetical protein
MDTNRAHIAYLSPDITSREGVHESNRRFSALIDRSTPSIHVTEKPDFCVDTFLKSLCGEPSRLADLGDGGVVLIGDAAAVMVYVHQ